jgi:hypothetical protein
VNLLKSLFLGRLLREKVLVFVFVLLGALIWLSAAGERFGATLRGYRSAAAELRTQALWLDNRVAIETAAADAARHLDASKTYDATFLVAEVMAMARRAGLTVNTEPPRTLRSPQFAVHTVQVTTRRAELASTLRFYQELASKAPYLGLERISIQGDRTAPGMLNITLQIASVELLNAPVLKAEAVVETPSAQPESQTNEAEPQIQASAETADGAVPAPVVALPEPPPPATEAVE